MPANSRYETTAESKLFFPDSNSRNLRLFNVLFKHSKDGVVVLSAEGKPLYVAPSIKAILGYDENEILREDFFSLSKPEDAGLISEVFKRSLASPGLAVDGCTIQMRHKNGSWRWIEATLTNMLDDPEINGIIDNFRDITDSREAQQKLVYANRLYSFISQLNQAIVHQTDEKDLLEEACAIAVNEGGFEFAWIGAAAKNSRSIDMIASAGATQGDISFFNNYVYDAGGPIEKVIRGRDYYVISDIHLHKNRQFVKYAESRGFKSAICLPIRKGGKVIGTYTMYSSEKHFFNDKEISLLREATNDISFALDLIENQKQKLAADKKLHQSEQRLIEAQATAQLGHWEMEFETGEGEWSEEALRIFGFTADDRTKPFEAWLQKVHPEDKEKVNREIQNIKRHHKSSSFLHRIVKSNGSVRWIFTKAGILLNEHNIPKGLKAIAHDVTLIKEAEAALRESELLNKGIIASLNSHLAVVDRDGTIIMVNRAWEDFALSNDVSSPEKVGKGSNYFDVCRTAAANGDEFARLALNGILAVIRRELPVFEMEYPCHSDQEKRWFIMQVTNFGNDDSKVVVLHHDNTERKIAEQNLQASEFNYRRIVETAQEGIWVVNEDGQTTFVNDKLCKILGYQREEILGKLLYHFMDDEGIEIAAHGMLNKRKGLNGNMHFKYISKSGKEVWTNISANPIFDDENNYRGALAMVSDITEHKALEVLLEKTNRMALIGSYELNLETNRLFWSEITKEIHEVDSEYEPEVSKAINFYKEGADRDSLTKALNLSIYDGKPFDVELRIVSARGNERWVRAIGEPEMSNGKCIRVFGSFQDIHQRKSAELELLRAYEEKNTILESFGDAFFAVDKNWIISYWNTEAERLLLRKREDLIGSNLWDCFPHYVGSETYNYYQAVAKSAKSVVFEQYYPEYDKWLEVSAYPSANGLSVYFKDITARKQADIKLKELNESLRNYTQELVISNKELEQFSYMVSHNLRAPLANIKGLSEELNDPEYDEQTRLLLKKELDNSVQKLDDVIIDMNYILQAKRDITEQKETVDLQELTDSVSASISGMIKRENVKILTDFTYLPTLTNLKSFLHSIFYNLITNSIKYRKPGEEPVIKISSQWDKDSYVLTFSDNGLGIDLQRHRQNIFRLYNRFHSHIDGKGMGLFMVKTQVETMGGKIYVESKPNEGTEFTIVFSRSAHGT